MHRLSQNGKCIYRLIPSFSLLSLNDFLKLSIHFCLEKVHLYGLFLASSFFNLSDLVFLLVNKRLSSRVFNKQITTIDSADRDGTILNCINSMLGQLLLLPGMYRNYKKLIYIYIYYLICIHVNKNSFNFSHYNLMFHARKRLGDFPVHFKPLYYHRYMDDTFVVFAINLLSNLFLMTLIVNINQSSSLQMRNNNKFIF